MPATSSSCLSWCVTISTALFRSPSCCLCSWETYLMPALTTSERPVPMPFCRLSSSLTRSSGMDMDIMATR